MTTDTTCLAPEKDPMGAAIRDYYSTGKAGRLRVFSSQFDEDEIPVAGLFRTYPEMPALEQKALQLAGGLILDVGAGSGCHTLALKEMGKDALPADISPLAVEVMRARTGRAAREPVRPPPCRTVRHGADADERFGHHREA